MRTRDLIVSAKDTLRWLDAHLREGTHRLGSYLASQKWPDPRQIRWRSVARGVAMASLAGLAALVLLTAAVYWWYARDLKSPDVAIGGVGPSVAYDRSGQTLLCQFADPLQGVREPVPLSEISPYLVAATVVTEEAASTTIQGSTSAG